MDQVKSQVALVKLLREKALHNPTLMIISSSLQLSIGCGYGYRIWGIRLARNYNSAANVGRRAFRLMIRGNEQEERFGGID
jgi:hypothetical protein